MLRIVLAMSVALSSLMAQAQTSLATNAPANTPLSTRVVAYSIDARVDVQKKTVDASETLTYRNLTEKPLDSFPFHLYLNAFQPTSTFTTETHFGGGIRDSEAENEYPAKKLGSIAITHLEADGFGDLTQQLHFVSPDDNNADDRTVALLTLPRAVAPGDSITFHMTFHDQLPESVARNGYKRDFLMGGQWFPKVGVFWHGKWNCHQYHATTEFFADFGTYNVSLTLPRNYTVGASGVPSGDHANSDGTRTLSFYGEDIHDFAWAASPHFTVTTGTYLSAMGPVQVRVLALREHPHAGQRYMSILMDSLKQFDARYGPYPYKVLTLIDPEPDSEMEGMEYPTLITGGTSWFAPTYDTEITAEHEFGHQYWYGMVATNEFEDAWLDEGINSYTEVNVTGAILGRDTNSIKLPWANLSDLSQQYLGYLSSRDFDPVTRHAWEFRDAESYGGVTYGKSAVVLKTLEGIVGQDTMDEAMRVYFMRFRFTHPTTEDFLRTIEEVAIRRGRATPVYGNPSGPGRIVGSAEMGFRPDLAAALAQPAQPQIIVGSSLRPYFEQAVYGTRVLDYAVDDISSEPALWWLPASNDKRVRNTVTIHRIGDFVLPVTLEVVFDDGSRVREYWDPGVAGRNGNDRWKTFTYVRNAEIVSAEIDPDHTVLLDVNHFNDSHVVKANNVPVRKLTGVWVWVMQLGSQVAGWLV
jgi:hypothetical protein